MRVAEDDQVTLVDRGCARHGTRQTRRPWEVVPKWPTSGWTVAPEAPGLFLSWASRRERSFGLSTCGPVPKLTRLPRSSSERAGCTGLVNPQATQLRP